VLLPHGHEERVILAEERRIGRQVGLGEGAHGLVSRPRRDQPMALQHAPGILVGDEHRAAHGIEKDGVGRLESDPVHREQLPAQGGQGRAPHRGKPPVEAIEQPAGEGAEPAGLHPVPSGRAQGALHLGLGSGRQSRGAEETAPAQRLDGALGAAPRGELDQDGSGRDLVGGSPGPPAPPRGAVVPRRAVAALERDVETEQPRLDEIARRAGDSPPPDERRAR
jgi:hypothetical protein